MVGDMERQAASLAALLGGTAFKTLQRKAAPCESKVWLCCAVAHQRTELRGGSPVFWHGGHMADSGGKALLKAFRMSRVWDSKLPSPRKSSCSCHDVGEAFPRLSLVGGAHRAISTLETPLCQIAAVVANKQVGCAEGAWAERLALLDPCSGCVQAAEIRDGRRRRETVQYSKVDRLSSQPLELRAPPLPLCFFNVAQLFSTSHRRSLAMQVMLVMPPGRDHDVQDMPRTRYAPPKSSLHCAVLYSTASLISRR
ncbi:hypothetical protein F5882DRAFT_379410 [Hyaloscypha sp. PMI_1271]|nr:hypothetical protein F5882DRAFT_379410 [Hyaloscypha sp. PMI_1271]